MTPAYRAALTAKAKSVAVPVASCVAARIPPSHLIGEMTRDELAALVIVLAEAADPVRLRVVVRADDDGKPGVTDLEMTCLGAHAEAVRLRAAKKPVPLAVRRLDAAYYQARYQARKNARQQAPEEGAA